MSWKFKKRQLRKTFRVTPEEGWKLERFDLFRNTQSVDWGLGDLEGLGRHLRKQTYYQICVIT